MQIMRESLESTLSAVSNVPRTREMSYLLDAVAMPLVPLLQVPAASRFTRPRCVMMCVIDLEAREYTLSLVCEFIPAFPPQAPLVNAVAVAEVVCQAQADVQDALRRLDEWFRPGLELPDRIRWVMGRSPSWPL